MSELAIRPMTPDDIPAATAVMDAGGWRGRQRFWEWVLPNPSIQAFVGLVDGRVAATGIGTRNGPVGWIGAIFVDAGMRRRGYGRAITDAVCRHLEAAGCRTLALIASDLGRPVYETMDFRIDAWYQIWEAETVAEPVAPDRGRILRQATEMDLGRIAALDLRATGEDRTGVLRTLTHRTWILEHADGAPLAGFITQLTPDSGSIVAPDPDDARLLLEHLRWLGHERADRVRAALVREPSGEAPAHARELLAAAGFRPAFETPRMLRGPSIDREPALIWGVLSFAFG